MAYTNTTSITNTGNPMGDAMGGLQNAFASIRNMFSPNTAAGVFGGPGGGQSGGGGSGAFGLAPQPVSGADNDLTAFQRSLGDLMGTGAASLLTGGQNLVNMGTGVTGAGVQAFAQPMMLTSGLLSGDPTMTSMMLGPQMNQAAQAQANLIDLINRGGIGPQGGASALARGNAQFALPGQFAQGAQALVPWAAGQQAGMANQLAGIGNQMGSLGANLASTGITGLGNDLNSILNKMQQNAEYGALHTFTGIAQGIGDILSGAGAAGGAKGIRGLCWIAEAIYGVDDMRTHIVRAYLNGPFSETWPGRIVIWFYRKFGRAVAALVRRFDWLKRAFKPLFDRALESALRYAWKQIYS